MNKFEKTFDIRIKSKTPNGGKIIISTPSVDRQSDRVFPLGMKIDRYKSNPVVCWGHNYSDPWATIGKTTRLDVTPAGIIADFELRPATSENDPQTIIRGLWDGGWIRTASIGFIALVSTHNEFGGVDFQESEMLEWSLCPIPAQADAVALALRTLEGGKRTAAADYSTLSPAGKMILYDFFLELRGKIHGNNAAFLKVNEILDMLKRR